MLEAIFWDVGGIFSARPVDVVATIAPRVGTTADQLFATVFGDYGADTDHPWHRLERGEIDLATGWGEMQTRLDAAGIELTLADLFGAFGDDPTDRSIVPDTLVELHAAGVRMGIITNNVREFSGGEGGGWHSIVPMEAISVVVDSSAVGIRKPDPAIFRHALAEMGVDAGSAAFVDDMPANVEAARGVGMHGVVMGADPAAAMSELRAVTQAG